MAGRRSKKGVRDEKNIVKSVTKAFAILHAFGPNASELVLADIARAAGLDNATTFRFLNTLVMLGYVERVGDTRRFRLTLKCLDLGFHAIARSDLRGLARPLLRDIVGDSIEAASIGVLDGNKVVYIERIQAGIERLGVDVRIGNRIPVYSSALGRAILSQMSLEDQRKILASDPPKRLTDHTIVDTDAILAEIAKAKKQGYAISDQETIGGVRVLAAPITDVDGIPIAALSATAPSFGHTLEEFIAKARDVTCNAAAQLSLAVRAAGGMAAHRLTA